MGGFPESYLTSLMTNKLFTTMAAASFLGCGAAFARPKDSRPNIIVFIVDDLGW